MDSEFLLNGQETIMECTQGPSFWEYSTENRNGILEQIGSQGICTSYCMSARAICEILASSLRASANIMTYSLRMNVIIRLLHDHQCQYIILALWSVPYIIHWHSGTFELVGYHATNTQ